MKIKKSEKRTQIERAVCGKRRDNSDNQECQSEDLTFGSDVESVPLTVQYERQYYVLINNMTTGHIGEIY